MGLSGFAGKLWEKVGASNSEFRESSVQTIAAVTVVKTRPVTLQACFGFKHFNTLLSLPAAGVLPPMKYSKNSNTAFWSSWLAHLHQVRVIEHRKVFELKTIMSLTKVC